MAETTTLQDLSTQGLFTCLSCSIAFHSADDQRVHYRSDHHRYNMKRRVAGLPPVTPDTFNQKVLERQSQNVAAENARAFTCDTCEKSYTTDNAFKSHLNSKKHRDNELKAAKKLSLQSSESQSPPKERVSAPRTAALTVEADATEDEVNKAIDEKIASASENRLSLTDCLFCSHSSSATLEANLEHMATAHSFFIPDAEYLDDLSGLITYLGEKLAIGNACLYCSNSGRAFRDLAAVRKHMADKGHCKIAYDTEDARLEVSDFYDFTSSYPEAPGEQRSRRKAAKGADDAGEGEEGEWEDDDEVNEVDEVVEIVGDSDLEDEDYDLSYGDTQYELVLPSGARIGHRKVRGLHPSSQVVLRKGRPEDEESAAALVRKYNLDKKSGIIPRKGGFGAFGQGLDVIKARNAGEAREAGKHIREFRDVQRREQFKTKVAFIHNNQKHFRDPFLQ